MRRIFAVLATVLVLAVAAQFFLAGMGAFDDAPKEESFGLHRAFGYGILAFAFALTLVAAAARLPGRMVAVTGLVAGLILLQIVIAESAGALSDSGDTGSTTGKLVFGLHAINAVIIAAMAGTVGNLARDLARSRSAKTGSGSRPRATEQTTKSTS